MMKAEAAVARLKLLVGYSPAATEENCEESHST